MRNTLPRTIAWVLALALSLVCSAERPSTMLRDEIADRFKWDLTSVYVGWEAWKADAPQPTLRQLPVLHVRCRARQDLHRRDRGVRVPDPKPDAVILELGLPLERREAGDV